MWQFLYSVHANKTDLYLIANSNWGLVYNTLFVVLARVKSCRVYLHHHVYSYISKKDLRMTILDRLMGGEGTHIVLCDEMGEKFKNYYSTKNRIVVLPNAYVLPDDWGYRPVPRKDIFSIGHISNLSIEKGLDLVIDTFEVLKEKDILVKLILAGPAKSKKEERIIEDIRNRFPHEIDYRGPVYGKDKVQFFDEIDAMLFPTKYVNEAQPLVVFESILKGVPVIAFDKGCIKSMMSDSGGIVIDSKKNFPDYAASIIENWIANERDYNKVKNSTIKRGEEIRMAAKNDFSLLIDDFCGSDTNRSQYIPKHH